MKITSKSQALCGPLPLAAWLTAAALTLLIGNLNSFNHMAEARYLPTRSDTSEIETLKNVIRELLIETATANSRPQLLARRFQQQPGFGPITGQTHSNFMQRRAAEISIGNSNGDEPDNFPMGSPVPEPSGRNTVQLFNGVKADRR